METASLELFLEEYEKALREEGDRLRGQKLPPLTEELFALYETNGNRLSYENVYFHRRKYLSVFGILSRLYGKKEDMDKLEEILWEICEEPCWALPAHVDRKNNSSWQLTVELFAAETAQALAELITVLEEKLPTKIKERVRREVFRRVLDPYIQSKAPYAWWEFCDMNWCVVCAGSIGSAAIYLMKDEPERLAPVLQRVLKAIPHYLDGFTEDGACLEGLGYYTYGMSFYAAFAAQAKEYCQRAGWKEADWDIMHLEKMEKIAHFQEFCYFSNGQALSFSDGSCREKYRMGLALFLAMEYPKVGIPDISLAAKWDSDACYRYLQISRDVFVTREYIKKKGSMQVREELPETENFRARETLPETKIAKERVLSEASGRKGVTCKKRHCTLPAAQWTLCESSNGCAMAAKGGHNDEPHNHNDIGSFLYFSGSEMFLADLGAGEYTKNYFGEERYHILCNRSLGHNVPLIHDLEQKEGRQYRCGFFETDGKGTIKIRMDEAYPLEEKAQLVRTLNFDLDTGKLQVQDDFQVNPKWKIKENLVTCYPVTAEKDGFILHGNDRDCRILSEKGRNFQILSRIHRDHEGRELPVYLLQWEVAGEQTRRERFVINEVIKQG